jgi:uncharacterized repeat protein (TIGR03803 family)
MEGPDGKLYGRTLFGGVGGCNGYCGFGLLYRINKDGSGFQILHKFCSQANCADGSSGGRLVLGTDGNFYGTSTSGGSSGYGVIFRVTPSTGAYQVVFNFGVSTGIDPSDLTVGSNGTLYGLSSGNGQILFNYDVPTGKLTNVPLRFPSINGFPSHGFDLTLGRNGNLYGLYVIYAHRGAGLFEVQPDGSHLQLFPFYTTVAGAGAPEGLLLASDGNFWIASANGSTGYGNIVSISPSDGSLIQTLTPFSASASIGVYPMGIIQAKDGTLWGETDQGGNSPKGQFADGTVFKLNAGLPSLP